MASTGETGPVGVLAGKPWTAIYEGDNGREWVLGLRSKEGASRFRFDHKTRTLLQAAWTGTSAPQGHRFAERDGHRLRRARHVRRPASRIELTLRPIDRVGSVG
jgi:hypothetical protein